MSTVRDKKSARNPNLKRRASNKKPAVIKATMPARATYSALPPDANPSSPPARMAAVAESEATTR